MPGDEWQRFANLRLLYSYMFTHPGTKLLFMGAEVGQYEEWNYNTSLDWHLLDHESHQGIKKLLTDLNKLYKKSPALHEKQFTADGFEWIAYDDSQNSVLSYIRKTDDPKKSLIVVCNFTPTVLKDYGIGLPSKGKLKEIFNSDDKKYWGSGISNGTLKITTESLHGKDYSAQISIPPLGTVVFEIL